MQVAVIGGAKCGDDVCKMAYELGKKLAKEGHIPICGGLGGVMEAVCHGVRDEGGAAIGILPGEKEDPSWTRRPNTANVCILLRQLRAALETTAFQEGELAAQAFRLQGW